MQTYLNMKIKYYVFLSGTEPKKQVIGGIQKLKEV